MRKVQLGGDDNISFGSPTFPFASSQAKKTVTLNFNVTDDKLGEGNETIVISLSNFAELNAEGDDIHIVGSDTATITTLDDDPPEAPENLVATLGGVDTIGLNWDDPVNSDITGWEYRVSQDGGRSWSPNWKLGPGSSRTTTMHAVAGLTAGEDYTIEVRAAPGGKPARITARLLDALANFVVSPGDTEVTLRWDETRATPR